MSNTSTAVKSAALAICGLCGASLPTQAAFAVWQTQVQTSYPHITGVTAVQDDIGVRYLISYDPSAVPEEQSFEQSLGMFAIPLGSNVNADMVGDGLDVLVPGSDYGQGIWKTVDNSTPSDDGSDDDDGGMFTFGLDEFLA